MVATYLDYRYETLDEIFELAGGEVSAIEELKHLLDEIVSKGGVSRREREDKDQCATAPPVLWGILEYQLKNLTPECLGRMGEYMVGELGLEPAIAKIPKTRVIPVEKSMEVKHNISTYDELRTSLTNILLRREPSFELPGFIARYRRLRKSNEPSSCQRLARTSKASGV